MLGGHELDGSAKKGRKSAGLCFALERTPFAVGREGAQGKSDICDRAHLNRVQIWRSQR